MKYSQIALTIILILNTLIGFSQDSELFWEKDKGFIDENGTTVFSCNYGWAGDFEEDLAIVFISNTDNDGYPKKGKYGYINKDGKEIIPCKYDDATDFSNGEAMVSLKGESFFINPLGEKKE